MDPKVCYMTHEPADCVCMNLRKAGRLMAQFYDQRLQPSGLRTTQFTLLATLQNLAPVSITNLSDHMGMDRTTLTRNVKPLEKDKLIASQAGEDARVRLLVLTARGETALSEARPYWESAQSDFLKRFGLDRWGALRGELTDINGVVSTA
jgi:DNA-binding MarR family transcriptional regulator